MKKYLFYFSAIALAALAMGCTKDDWKADVEALKKPAPTDIVILDASAVTAVKGTQFQLRFRVNPSGVEVTKENLELDLRNSDTYVQYDPDQAGAAAQSKASYVTPSDYYGIVGVEADRNAAGEPLDGQWVVTVATRGEGNFRNGPLPRGELYRCCGRRAPGQLAGAARTDRPHRRRGHGAALLAGAELPHGGREAQPLYALCGRKRLP